MATFGNVEESLSPDPLLAGPSPKTKRKLKPSITISGLAAEVFSVRFSPDGKRVGRRLALVPQRLPGVLSCVG